MPMNISSLWIPKILAALLLAIVYGRMGFAPQWSSTLYLFLLLGCLVLYFVVPFKNLKISLVFLFVFILGLMRSHEAGIYPYNVDFDTTTHSKSDSMALQIVSDVQVKENIARATALLLRINDSTLVNPKKVLLSLLRDSSEIKGFLPGSQVLMVGELSPLQNSEIPGAFSSKEHFSKKGLHFRALAKPGKWMLIASDSNAPFAMTRWSRRVQELGLQKIRKWPGETAEKQVLTALLLGNKDELDPEISKAFSQTGLIHILAVSGLHVGIIFLVLNTLLRYWFWRPKHRFVRFIGILIGLWIYAFVSGLSPSVLRASLMFSFLTLGGVLYQKGNIYQTLALSAFILLLYQPGFLFQIGFQLSYIAVFGIVYLQPTIYQAFVFKTWLFDKAWQLLSVTLAAQIFTLPLTLYYFGMFPIYFLISNLIVLPAVPLVVGSGLAVLLIQAVIPAWNLLGWIPIGLAKGIYYITQYISYLPGSYAQGLYIDSTTMTLLSLFVLSLSIALKNAHKQWLTISFAWLVLIQVQTIYKKKTQLEEVFIADIQLGFGHFLHLKSGSQHEFVAFDIHEKWRDYYGFYLDKYLNSKGFGEKYELHELGNRSLRINLKNRNLLVAKNLDRSAIQDADWLLIDQLRYKDLKWLSNKDSPKPKIWTSSKLDKSKMYLKKKQIDNLPPIEELKLHSYRVIWE